MFAYSEKKSQIVSIVSAVLVLAFLVLQFFPLWYYNDGKKTLYTDAELLKTDLEAEAAERDAYNAIKTVADKAIADESKAKTLENQAANAKTQAERSYNEAVTVLVEAGMMEAPKAEEPTTTEDPAGEATLVGAATKKEGSGGNAGNNFSGTMEATDIFGAKLQVEYKDGKLVTELADGTTVHTQGGDFVYIKPVAEEKAPKKAEIPELKEYKDEVIGVSAQGFVWFPEDHGTLTKIFDGFVNGFKIDQIIGLPILSLLAGAFAIFFALKSGTNSILNALFTLTSSISAAVMMLNPLFQMGFGWYYTVIVAGVATLIGLYQLTIGIVGLVKKTY